MIVTRIIVYDGPARWVKGTLKLALPDGEHQMTKNGDGEEGFVRCKTVENDVAREVGIIEPDPEEILANIREPLVRAFPEIRICGGTNKIRGDYRSVTSYPLSSLSAKILAEFINRVQAETGRTVAAVRLVPMTPFSKGTECVFELACPGDAILEKLAGPNSPLLPQGKVRHYGKLPTIE